MIYNGFRIIESGRYPKQKLGAHVICTDEFRESTDIWLAGFFGYTELLADCQVIQDKINNTFTMNAATKLQLTRSMEKHTSFTDYVSQFRGRL
jgi:hypothetical protein